MKEFFNNKTNIILSFLLSVVVGAGVFFTILYFNGQDKTLVPDFTNKTKNDVETWCNSFDTNPCTINTDYSDTVEKDYVIYQSLNAEEELKDSISFIISLGKSAEITLPTIDENTTRSTIEKWANEIGLTNVTYIDEASETVDSGNVIRIEPSSGLTINSEIKVYVSTGKDISADANGIIHIDSDTYTKLSEEQFIAKVKALGLTASYASKKDAYSSTVSKGYVVWHGSGDYIEGEEIHYGLSLGKEDSQDIVIEADQFKGKTEDEVKEAVTELGLTPNHGHSYYEDEYSDTYAKGTVIWHGSGTYEKGEKFNYVLSLGKKDTTTITISSGTYIGKTEEEVKEAVTKLGLTPNHGHSTKTDEYSDTYAKGTVIWHGSGDYEKGEKFNYVLSLGSAPKVTVESKVGTTESEFKTYLSGLGLKTGTRSESYSDSVASGSIISNDTGTYTAGSTIKYTVSLGKDTRVDVADYSGQDASTLESFISNKGLVGSKSEQYSSSVAQGKVISNTSGKVNAGATIYYVVSKGEQPETKYTIMTAGYYGSYKGDTFDATKSNLSKGPFVNFTNVTYTGQVSDKTAGVILSVKVNGSELSATGEYVASTPIEIVISTGN